MKYLKAKNVVLENGILENAYVAIEGDLIADIFAETDKKAENINPEDVVDYKDGYIAPGFVDTHVHGMLGKDIMDLDEESVKVISEGALEIGVTSFLPTTLTASVEDTKKAVEAIKNAKDDAKGAKIQGIFLEGPFFTEKHKGAQNPEYFMKPDIEIFNMWQEASGNLIKKIAIAPEIENAVEFVKEVTSKGVHVALGHSDATYDEAKASVEAGANIFVHTYNGMSPLHHRNPGMVGAAITLDDVFAELICDGHHVHPAAAKVVMNSRGRDETVLITDCMMAGSMKDGQYKLGDFDVTVKDGTARLESGNLAGSVLKLKDAIKNVVEWKIATPFEAIQMASLVPAKSVEIDDVCGKLEIGRKADITVLDKNLDIVNVYLDGVKRK